MSTSPADPALRASTPSWSKGKWLVIAAAVLFSTGGAGIKAEAFSGLQVSAVRSGIAALLLVIWIRGRVQWSPTMLASSSVYAATVTLFVLATKLTTAANAIFLQSTAPLYIVILGPWLLGERLHRRDIAYLVAMAAGMTLCFIEQPSAQATAPDPGTGNVLGLLSAVSWALTLISLRYAERGSSSGSLGSGMSAVVVGNAIACLIALPLAFPFPDAPAAQWATLAYLGVFQIGLAYVCLTAAMAHVPALEASLLLLIEPVLNPLWTWIIRGETPGEWTVVGGALILSATATMATKTYRTQRTR